MGGNSMKAARVQADGSLVVSEVPEPEPGPGDVIVKVAYCGICGTDLHMLDAGILPPGCIIGHEVSGTVAQDT
jgi:D-arabinose 1-dehydrogenase-like Zn-dependent alcohol dehydrogenase